MRSNQRIHAALFDLDGTLVDTSGDIAFAVNRALELEGFAEVDSGVCMRYVGNGLRNTLRGILGELGVPIGEVQLQRMLANLLEAYRASPWQRSVPYRGISALLEKSVAAGLALGVLSNKDDALVRALVGHWFGHIPFLMVRGADAGFPLKPDPQGALAFADLAGCDPEKVLLVGDSEVDHRTALAASMRPATVTWGFRSRNALEAAGCEILCDSIEELEREVFPWV